MNDKAVLSITLAPKTSADQEKLGQGLAQLMAEDPTLRVTTDQATGEVIIAGMGELHLEIIVDRLKREFGVEASVGKPQVAYKETLTVPAEGRGRFIRQTGGRWTTFASSCTTGRTTTSTRRKWHSGLPGPWRSRTPRRRHSRCCSSR
jgi:translation elongation factor EF-G